MISNWLRELIAIFLGVLIMNFGLGHHYFDEIGYFHLVHSLIPDYLTITIAICFVLIITKYWWTPIISINFFFLTNFHLFEFPNYDSGVANLFLSGVILILNVTIILTLILNYLIRKRIVLITVCSLLLLDGVWKLFHTSAWNYDPPKVIHSFFIVSAFIVLIKVIKTSALKELYFKSSSVKNSIYLKKNEREFLS
ncbi:hypothetical protein BTR22_10050 [Alkalihalophilus pseudofirmus]|uniref:hypothetical protein n=1 Tax=Alkalihalophilus pseudofirmus TaxID=79885 RepID=UPI0009513C11|nr:hypothetical protein BTR22_10050 [Alkalihalophilus pseudofirmus]